MNKYRKLINLVHSWLPGRKDIYRALLFAGVMISAGFFFTIGAQLADRPIQITIENAE